MALYKRSVDGPPRKLGEPKHDVSWARTEVTCLSRVLALGRRWPFSGEVKLKVGVARTLKSSSR